MTDPKQTAESIKDKFLEELEVSVGYLSEEQIAKVLSIIHVNGIIEATNKFADYWDLRNGEWYKDEIANLQSVLKEIENL